MRLGHAKRRPHMIPVPTLLQADGVGTALVLLLLAFIVAAVVAFVLVAIWLYNDAKQRGENSGMWLTLFLVIGIVTGIIGAVIVLVIYLATRSKDVKYDRQGNLLVPGAPSSPAYYAQPSGWQSPPAPSPGYGMPPSPPAPSGYPTPQQPNPSRAVPQQPWMQPALSKVRCPRCRTVFEYQKQPVGQTHVKCPACGEEGNI